jgi:cell wall-associated NlpC family hydrolase
MSGCDCGGLVLLVCKAYGLPVPEFSETAQADIPRVISSLAHGGQLVRLDAPEEPSLVTMATDSTAPDAINHVGVYVGGGDMLHVRRGATSHRVRISNPLIAPTIRSFYRVRY